MEKDTKEKKEILIKEKIKKKNARDIWRQLFYQKAISHTAGWVEIFISALVLVAVIFYAAALISRLFEVITTGGGDTALFSDFLGNAFQIVIGIEFIKMLCKHTPATVVEVLMFAIARQMVVEHSTPMENLICIAGITVLFAIRRFLFTESDKEDHYQVNITDDSDDVEEEH